MLYLKSLAVSLGVILLLSGVLAAGAQRPTLVFLSLDPVPSVVSVGDEVVFSGTLVDINGNGLAGKVIMIVEERSTGVDTLATAETDENGNFVAIWIADLHDPTRDRTMSVAAAFSGDAQYTAAKSGRAGLKVAIATMNVSFRTDKQVYFMGEIATFTIRFMSPSGEPFDPTNLRAAYDGRLVSLERESEGVYVFKTPPLNKARHTLQVVAEKHGYRVFNDASSINVFARQTLPGLKLDFNWSPTQVLPGMPVTFTLSFTDDNNIVMPFVNYDFIILRGNEVVLELRGEQTTDGTSTHQHAFEEGGRYSVTVRVNGIGQAPDIVSVLQISHFDVDVIRSTALEARVKAMQRGDAMRVTVTNPALAPTSIYAFSMKLDDPDQIRIRTPSGWSMKTEGGIIKLETTTNPIEPGKSLRLRALVDDSIRSFEWSVAGSDGKVLKSGIARVLTVR